MYKIDLKMEKNGLYMGVRFANGKGETESAYLAKRFKAKGFTVEAESEKKPDERPIDKMTTEQLKAKASEVGADITACTKNEQRVAAILAHIEAGKDKGNDEGDGEGEKTGNGAGEADAGKE